MARKDYLKSKDHQQYDVGTQLQFKPAPYGRPLNHKTAWYMYIPGYLVMAPAALITTFILAWFHINTVVQMLLVIGLAFLAKFWVDWKLKI